MASSLDGSRSHPAIDPELLSLSHQVSGSADAPASTSPRKAGLPQRTIGSPEPASVLQPSPFVRPSTPPQQTLPSQPHFPTTSNPRTRIDFPLSLLQENESTPPPFFNSLPALANLSPLFQSGVWTRSGSPEREDGAVAASVREGKKRGWGLSEEEAKKVLSRQQVEDLGDRATPQDEAGQTVKMLAQHALALEVSHNLERQAFDQKLSSLSSQYSSLALTLQSTLDKLALKDAEITSLKAQAAALFTKANKPALAHAVEHAGGGQNAVSPRSGAHDGKTAGGNAHLYGDYAPSFAPYLEKAKEEEVKEQMESEKRVLISDKRFLKRRVRTAEAQVETLSRELRHLRTHLLHTAPHVVWAQQRQEQREATIEPTAAAEEEAEGVAVDEEEDDDGPDYPYEGSPPARRTLELPPTPTLSHADPTSPRGPKAALEPGMLARHSISHPQEFDSPRHHRRSKRRHRRRTTMGDAGAEHLLLASRHLTSQPRPMPRFVPRSRRMEEEHEEIDAGQAAPRQRASSAPAPMAAVAEVEEESDEIDEDGDVTIGGPPQLESVRYGPRRTSDIRATAGPSQSGVAVGADPTSPSRFSGVPLSTSIQAPSSRLPALPGLIKPGAVPDAPPVKRGRHGASASVGSAASFSGGTGSGIFVAPQTPSRRPGHDVPPGSPTRSGGMEDLLAAAQTVLTRPSSPSSIARGQKATAGERGLDDEEDGEGREKRRRVESEPTKSPTWDHREPVDRRPHSPENQHAARLERPHDRYPSALDVLADQAFASQPSSQESNGRSPSPTQHARQYHSSGYNGYGHGPYHSASTSQQATRSYDDGRYPSVLMPAPDGAMVEAPEGAYAGSQPHPVHPSRSPPYASHHQANPNYRVSLPPLAPNGSYMPSAPSNDHGRPHLAHQHGQHYSTQHLRPIQPAYGDYGHELTGPELTPAAAAAKKARSPYVKWTLAEDELLVKAVSEHGQRWDAVSKCVPTRSYHQCRQRWLRGLKSGENLPDELQSWYPAIKVALRAHATMRTQTAANRAARAAKQQQQPANTASDEDTDLPAE